MQVSLVSPPKIFARNPAGRMVQISGSAGDIGKYENVVVPDEQAIRHLRPVIRYMEKLKPKPLNYGTSSGYRKYPEPPPLRGEPIQFNRTDDLPLFEKR